MLAVLAQDFAEEPREESRAEILERQRRSVEELEQQKALAELARRHGEVQRAIDHAVEDLWRELALEQALREVPRDGIEPQASPRPEIRLAEPRQVEWLIEAAVGRQTPGAGPRESRRCGDAVMRAAQLHLRAARARRHG